MRTPFAFPHPHPEVRAKRASKERMRLAQDDGSSKERTRYTHDRPGRHLMPRVSFSAHLQRHVPTPELEVKAASLREALAKACMDRPKLRGYILDEQGRLRRHVAVYVNGYPAKDRVTLS